MAKQSINIGTSANDRTGDSLRSAFNKINENFTDLYTALGLDEAPLNLGAFEFTGSVLTTTDSSAIVIDQATTITSNLTVGGDILPSGNLNANLGSATNRFRDLYLSSSTIDLGGTTLSVVGGELQLGGVKVPTTADVAASIASAVSAPTGDLTGSVFADDSTLLVDGVNGKINLQNTVLDNTISTSDENFFINTAATPGDRGFTNITTTDSILDIQGAAALPGGQGGGIYINGGIPFDDPSDYTRYGDIIISGRFVSILTGDGEGGGGLAIAGPVFGTTVMDIKGSVFGDDSTVLVDGVAGKIVGPVDTASVTFADDTVQTTAYVERFVNRSTFTSDYTITPGSATILQFDAFQGSRAFDAVTYQWTVANTGLYRLDFVLGLTESEVDLPLTVFLFNTAGFVNQITLFSGDFTGTTISMSGTTYLTAGQSYQFGIIQKVTGSNIILDKDLTSVGIEQLTNA